MSVRETAARKVNPLALAKFLGDLQDAGFRTFGSRERDKTIDELTKLFFTKGSSHSPAAFA